jgi:FixJ family two-component response regulator
VIDLQRSHHASLKCSTCVIAGMLNKQIASQLGTTEGTIKVHRGRVMEKMDATSVADLVILAQKAGIAPASADATKV